MRGPCGVGGCRGLGSLRGGPLKQHSAASACPYRPRAPPALPDRLGERAPSTDRALPRSRRSVALRCTTTTTDGQRLSNGVNCYITILVISEFQPNPNRFTRARPPAMPPRRSTIFFFFILGSVSLFKISLMPHRSTFKVAPRKATQA